MKIKLMLPLLGVLTFAVSPLRAQEELPTSKPQVTAPYKLAVGLRYASGPAGLALGVTAKYFIREQSAQEVYSDLNPESRHFLSSVSYIWQPKLATSNRLRPYAGIGLGLLRTNNPAPAYFDGPASYINPVGVASFGVEYSFKKIPLALSFDYRSTFVRYGRSTPSYVDLNKSSNIGLGLKYTFR